MDDSPGSAQPPEAVVRFLLFLLRLHDIRIDSGLALGQFDGISARNDSGFMERLYPYTEDPRTLAFLENFVDYADGKAIFQTM
jgi:hypothetical protein